MDASAPRSSSRPRPTSRPTTPLRPSSRSSIRNSHGYGSSLNAGGYEEPAIHALEPQFAELADSMADLEANFMHLQLMHESLSRFSESFAGFLYGLNMNAFCVDFPEAPIPESFKRAQEAKAQQDALSSHKSQDADATFLTTDTSFIDNPPTTSSKATPKKTTRGGRPGTSTRGTTGSRYGTRGGTARGRPSGLPRGRGNR